MPMFRKRPVTVEARPWDSPDAAYGLIEWAGEDVLSYDESTSGPPGPVGEAAEDAPLIVLAGLR